MTDKDHQTINVFMEKVRDAYRQLLREAENPDEAKVLAQDKLSLFSPWMNN
jgi:hypothetical protein